MREYVVRLNINNIRVIQRIYNDLQCFEKRLVQETIKLESTALWDDLISLIVVTGFIKYLHPEKITEAEKVDAEAWTKEQESSSRRYRKKLKSEAEILTELVQKEVKDRRSIQKINPNFSTSSSYAIGIIATSVSDGVLPSDAGEILKLLKKIKEDNELQTVGEKVRSLLDMLQFDLDIPNDTEIKRQINEIRANADKVLYRDIVELLSILERFGFKEEAKDIAEKWKDILGDAKKNQFIVGTLSLGAHRSEDLENAKIDDSAMAIIHQVCPDLIPNKQTYLLGEAKRWIERGMKNNPFILKKFSNQSDVFWKQVFEEEKKIGASVGEFLENEINDDNKEKIEKAIKSFLEHISKQSSIYKTRYAEYLLTPEQKSLKEAFENAGLWYLDTDLEPEELPEKKDFENLSQFAKSSDEWTEENAKDVFGLLKLSELLTVAKSCCHWAFSDNQPPRNDEACRKLRLKFLKLIHPYLLELSSDKALTDYQREKIKEVLETHPWEELVAEAKKREVPPNHS